MPIYGDQKTREIARGTLASSHRKGAKRKLATVKREERRATSQALRDLTPPRYSFEVVNRWEVSAYDWVGYPDARINRAKRDRQDYEKLAPVLRWAPHQVKDVRLLDRSAKIRKILPDTLQGRHAAGHVDDLPEFYVPTFMYPWATPVRAAERQDRRKALQRAAEARTRALKATLYFLWAQGLHQRFNDALWPREGWLKCGLCFGRRNVCGYHSSDRFQGPHDIDRIARLGEASLKPAFDSVGVLWYYYMQVEKENRTDEHTR